MDFYALFLQFELSLALMLFALVIAGFRRQWNPLALMVVAFLSAIFMAHSCSIYGVEVGWRMLIITVMLAVWLMSYKLLVSHAPGARVVKKLRDSRIFGSDCLPEDWDYSLQMGDPARMRHYAAHSH